MIIQQADLFKDLSEGAINDISKIMVEETYEKNTFVFEAGAPTQHFYILIEGRVRLFVGTRGQITYTVTVPGEAFGWTGLVDRPTYTATAECVSPSKVVKIDKAQLAKLFEKDTASGMKFFKRLAGAVVQRLVYNYETVLSEGTAKEAAPSYG
jgi:CRP-like cAMP-binding protein